MNKRDECLDDMKKEKARHDKLMQKRPILKVKKI